MTTSRIFILLALAVLIGVPIVYRPDREVRSDVDGEPAEWGGRLIIITPHNEMIRYEFARGFERWHERNFGERVNVIWSVPGGTSEIRRMLFAQFAAAVEQGREVGGAADLVFGGGSFEHDMLKRGTRVVVNGQTIDVPVSQPVDFTDDWLLATYGPNLIGDTPLYDPDKHWFGTALSAFGIVYNRDVLTQLALNEPSQWEDLCDPRLDGWIALVNPGQSGSITTAFDTILQRRGWEHGWRILRRAGANSRYFSASALKGPVDVSQGNAAMGVCIDFYGRYQSQAILSAGGGARVGYIDPPGATSIDPDPISMLRNAPQPELAQRFIEFTLTEEGQALWQFSAEQTSKRQNVKTSKSDSASDHFDVLTFGRFDVSFGPERFELRRLPVLRSMYERHMERMIDQVNAFEIASPVYDPSPHFRDFIAPIFAAAVMDSHHDLRRAWRAIVNHPAYPRDRLVVTAEDVTDPTLREMLTLFDAMPLVQGLPDDARAYSIARRDDLGPVRSGWLRGGWAEYGLWHPETTPVDELRRQFTRFFRENYQQIVRMAEDS